MKEINIEKEKTYRLKCEDLEVNIKILDNNSFEINIPDCNNMLIHPQYSNQILINRG